MEFLKPNKNNFKKIITALKNGAVLVCPTDTVYGLVCDAHNNKAVEKIFEIKKRDKTQTVPVFVKDIEQAKELADISPKQEKVLRKNWPGQVTGVLEAKPGLSELVYRKNTIALRMPKYELLNQVLDRFGGPLAQTSANISGEGAITEIAKIKVVFEKEDVLVVDAGDLPKSKPSTIIDLTSDTIKVLRK